MVTTRKRKPVKYESSSDSDFEDDQPQQRPVAAPKKKTNATAKKSDTKKTPTKKAPTKKAPTKKAKKVKEVSESEESSSESEDESENELEKVVDQDSFEPAEIDIPRPKGSPFPDAIPPDSLEFLAGLMANNHRDYVRVRRKEFDKMRSDFTDFIGILMQEMYSLDPSIRREDPKFAVYRMNRDLRFTNDKRPYKTNLSAAFSINGRKMIKAGYYISIQPGNKTQICCGLWQPRSNHLANIRSNIQRNPDLLKEALSTDAIKELFDGKYGVELLDKSDMLKVAPKGVDKNHPEIELLRYKNFALQKNFTDLEVVSPGFSELVLDCLEAYVPFITVLNAWT